MKTRLHLLKGLWMVLTREWVNDYPWKPGQVCAVRAFADEWRLSGDAWEALSRALPTPNNASGFPGIWNDHPDRTRGDVVRLYLKALVRG